MKNIALTLILASTALLVGGCATGPTPVGQQSPPSKPITIAQAHEQLGLAQHGLATLNDLIGTINRFRY